MRRLLVQMALAAGFVLLPVASAQAGDPPTNVTAQFVPGAPAHVTVSFTPALDPLLNYEVRMCQSSATCDTVADGTSYTVGALAPKQVDIPVAVTDFGCRIDVVSSEPIGGAFSTPEPNPPLVVPQCDQVAPTVSAVLQSGGDGCSPFAVTSVTATDGSGIGSYLADGVPATLPYTPAGPEYEPQLTVQMTAIDTVGNASTPFPVLGRVYDPTRPPAPVLEVTTDPSQQKATFNWDPIPDAGAPTQGYHLRTKGPQGTSTQAVPSGPVVRQNLQVDATYEFALSAYDACGDGLMSVRLVRLNDSTPPSMPIVAGPSFNPASHAITLSWVASDDNIQVDHYAILRNGVPLGATDGTVFTDLAVPEHTQLSYVVRAVDTNGNATDSAPAPYMTPDWTPPTAPVPTLSVQGTTVTLRWPPAADNVGVVGYDVLRDDKQRASMTSAVRTYSDIAVPPGVHTWRVRARDDAQLSAVSAPLTTKMAKQVATAKVLAMRLVGGGAGAARYSLKARTRLLVDLRVFGTLAKPTLRLYLRSGRGRITVWRGTPGSSAPRLRLGSALARPGFVTIRLNRTLHAGRIRLVLVPSGPVVVVGEGAHRPSMKTG